MARETHKLRDNNDEKDGIEKEVEEEEKVKMYSYDEVYQATLDYFGGSNDLAAKICVDKYLLRDTDGNFMERTPDDMHRRIARELARVERNKFKVPLTEDEIYDYLKDFRRIIPQGSPMYGIGNPYQYVTLSNCYVTPPVGDSFGAIHRTDEYISQIAKRRGGQGFDLSPIRPAGFVTRNSSRTATGVVSFMERFSNSGREVGAEGRRAALMFTISVHHPDIIGFIESKKDRKKVTGANISVRYTDEFLRAVENDEEYEQRWPVDSDKPLFTRKVKARDVWKIVVENAHENAEPGVLFWNRILDESVADIYEEEGFRSVSTNPCCFAKSRDVWVVTRDGIKEIKDISSSDEVWVEKLGAWSKTSGYFVVGVDNVYDVTFSNKEVLRTTANHRFATINYRKVNNRYVFSQERLKEVKDITSDDRIQLQLSDISSDVRWGSWGNANEGAILGWLTGDGYLSFSHPSEAFPITVLDLFSGEFDLAPKLQECLANLGFEHSIQDWPHRKQKRVSSTSFSRYFIEKYNYNIWKFKGDDELNPFLFKASREFVKEYLRYYFSADGGVRCGTKKNTNFAVVLCSINRIRLDQIKYLLLLFGIKSTVNRNRGAEQHIIRGKIYNTKEYWSLVISGRDNVQKFADEIGFAAAAKSTKLNERLALIRPKSSQVRPYCYIESVVLVGREPVGCISVEEGSQFTANGIVSGNSELPLSSFDSCRLLLLNLLTYVSDAFTDKASFDFDAFFADCKIAQRLMDDIVDLEIESIERILQKIDSDPESNDVKHVEKDLWENVLKFCKRGRRTGTGITALGDTLAACGHKYDNDDAIELTSKIYRTLKHACYSSSIDMAEEIGSFPIWNAEKEKDHPFLNRLQDERPDLHEKMMRVGRRNIALLTTAPAGTVSNLAFSGIDGKTRVFGTTSGIEPAFMLSYVRRKKITGSEDNVRVDFLDQNGDRWQNFEVVHPPIATWRAITGKQDVKESPWFGSCAEELDWRQRVKLQAIANLEIEHSISSTLNVPRDVSVDKVAEIFETAWKSGVKGITIYRNGCRDGVLVESAETKDIIVKTKAAKRPRSLVCDIHHLTVKGVKHNVIVGLLEDEPYEVMVTLRDVPPRFTTGGKLKKVRRGHYELILPDNSVVDGVNECDADQEALLRMTSTALRHGADIGFVVHQLEKTKGDMLGFAKCVARALKKYVKDGTAVSGEQCPDCGSQSLIRQEGCVKCVNCQWTRCS